MSSSSFNGPVVGIVGGGQLGRMLALAGAPLGVECRVLEPAENPPAAIAANCLKAPFEDAGLALGWANQVDVVTYEFENIPTATLEAIAATIPVRPSPTSLQVSCDRLREKQLFATLGIPTTCWVIISCRKDLDQAVEKIGYPLVIKTRRFGYDGKGQFVARKPKDLELAWNSLGPGAVTVGLLVEGLVPFHSEVSQISVRGLDGKICHYPLTRNVHHQGILRMSSPLEVLCLSTPRGKNECTLELVSSARKATAAILENLGHVGVLAVEFFERDGQLIANEIAPRVHNSGHWTQDGAGTSQFENHLRAILGWPLGETHALQRSCMVNLVGEIPKIEDILAIEGTHLHLYGKEIRPGRKVGHINIRRPDFARLVESMRLVAGLLSVEAATHLID